MSKLKEKVTGNPEFADSMPRPFAWTSTCAEGEFTVAGWSSLVAREAHNLEVVGSNPAPAT